MASWFETRGVAALLTMRVSDLILRSRAAASRRMGHGIALRHNFTISRRVSPEVLHLNVPPQKQRAQGRPGARCTRGLACNCAQRTRTRAYRFSGSIPAFPAQWLYGLLRTLPGERLSCHRRRRDTSRRFDASTAASGPHDFAVRVGRLRLARLPRPPHPTARS